jgi:D-glycero-alpha-D-manno-heptose 1-phosphate guanylyltransferase
LTVAIVLAGGLGTRLRSVVPDLPKPMAPINGRPFLEYQLEYWIQQGVSRFVLSLGYRHESITAHFGTSYLGIPIEYSIEEKPLGTGGGLLLAMQRIADSEFLLLNGDTFFEVDLKVLHQYHTCKNADWTFAMFRSTESGRYMGMGVAEDGRIAALSASGDVGQLVNGGVYYVNTGSLRLPYWKPGTKISLEEDILSAALDAGAHLFGLPCDGAFIDIGVPQDYFRATSVLKS